MNTPPTQGPARPRRRRSLYLATMLVPAVGLVVFAGQRLGWIAAGPGLVQEAYAQQATPAAPPGSATVVPATAPSAPAIGSEGGALSVLLEQANYWRGQQQYDQAIAALNRAAKISPDSPDLLALTGELQAEHGNKQAAEAALTRLRQVAPGDSRIDKIDQMVRVGVIPQEALADARRLAHAGKQAEAVDRYNRVLKGNPPPDSLAIEYYQTLSGTEGGWEQARDGLAKLVRQNPQDLRAQLAYAQVLTFRDGPRVEGVNRLAALAQNPAVAEQATQAWRQALGWLPDAKDSIEPLSTYLATHPNDSDIAGKLEAARNPLLSAPAPVRARLEGFDSLNKGKLAEAEKQFQTAVDSDPNDADATGGLGLVKLRQKNFADAKTLLTRAIALDPEHKGRWQSALTAASNPGGGANPAVAMINKGDLTAAEREISAQAAKGGDVTGLLVMLADAQARQGQLEQAEATYRSALSRAPNNGPGIVGLAGVLSRTGRSQEASELLERAQTLGNSKLVATARALLLREQAAAITDPQAQAALYRSAVAADPENPWIRLDLARALVRLGQVPDARAVMAEVIGPAPTVDQLKAGIIFANETSDPDAAAVLIARLPANQRTADMMSLQVEADLQRQVGSALMLSRPAAHAKLMAMASAADPTGARGAAIAKALGSIGDKVGARDAIITAGAATPNQTAAAKLRYAGAMLDLDDPVSAQEILAEIGSPRSLPAEQRQIMVQLLAGLAVRTADTLNAKGKQAEAYEHLAPLLAQAPNNPDLNMALARLYQGARNPREALQINEALLRRDPANSDARHGAIDAALQLGDRRLAEQLVQEGLQLTPNDPKSWIQSADLARASGNNARALRDLEHARELRLQQLGYSDNGSDTAVMPGVSLVPGQAPVYQPVYPQPQYRAPAAPTPLAPSADNGADQPQDLSVPPLLLQPPAAAPRPAAAPAPALAPAPAAQIAPAPAPLARPFQPQATTAAGTAPSYQPQPAAPQPVRKILDTRATSLPAPAMASAGGTSADQMNAQELGRNQAMDTQPVYQAQPAYQPPYQVAQAAPAYAPQYPAYQQPIYQQPAYQQPAYQQPVYQQPAYAPPVYQQQAYPQQYYPQPAYQQQGYQPAYMPPQYAPAVPQQFQYAPQVQQVLPQYQPYVPPPQPAPVRAVMPQPANPFPAPVIAPSQRAQGYYNNPFRSGVGGATADAGQTGMAAPDPVTEQIDRSIVALRDTVAPSLKSGFDFRSRSGDSGLDRLDELTVPLEATFSPGGYGQLKLAVVPTIVNAGTLGGDITNQQRFGSNALALKLPTGGGSVPVLVGTAPGSQSAQGLGLDLAYAVRNVKLDVGSTPIGFKSESIVGGAEWAPQITDALRLRLTADRRAVDDSLLSYESLQDPNTGDRWGGVTRTRGKANLEFSSGRADFYVGGGYDMLVGQHVEKNSEIEFGAGGSYPIMRGDTSEVRVGLDLVYFSYAKNLRFFTLGQGGYFSPQSYYAALIPLSYKDQVDEDLSFEVGGAVGIESFRENASPYFPMDSGLQAQLVANQANSTTSINGVQTQYPARGVSGFAGNGHATVDYRVSPNLHLGGTLSFQHAGDFEEASGLVYAKYLFNGSNGR